MNHPMNTTELYLVAMLIIFSLPYLVWRGLRTEAYAPLAVVQIIGGIVLGPGVLGALFRTHTRPFSTLRSSWPLMASHGGQS